MSNCFYQFLEHYYIRKASSEKFIFYILVLLIDSIYVIKSIFLLLHPNILNNVDNIDLEF